MTNYQLAQFLVDQTGNRPRLGKGAVLRLDALGDDLLIVGYPTSLEAMAQAGLLPGITPGLIERARARYGLSRDSLRQRRRPRAGDMKGYR